MANQDLSSVSKFLSYVLRHHPDSIDLELDEHGWAKVSELITKAASGGKCIDVSTIKKIIDGGDKQRFILSEGDKYIRAGYGHSIDIDLQLRVIEPPKRLYHGTARKNVDSILKKGIQSGSRNLVHLSAQKSDALEVGARHGQPVILCIESATMAANGHNFYQSDSEPDIWLTKYVPPKYVSKLS